MRFVLSISAGLAVVSVVLAALWISHGPRPQPDQARRTAAVPISQQPQRLDSRGQAIRTIATGPSPGSEAGDPRPPQAKGGVDPAPDAGSPARLADVAPAPGLRTDTAANAAADPAAPGGGVDLNSASVEQLNALGAGMIGKRIIEFRPYASPEELVTRRVLKKSDYEAIRSAITVR